MSNDNKPKTDVLPTIPAVPEVQGIDTAITGIQATESRLTAAIHAAGKVEADLATFRTAMTAKPAGIEKEFLTAHQAELEAQITGASRKAVSDALKEVQMHMTTISTLAQQIQSKHGLPVSTVKHADRGTGRGDITAGNMDALREMLQSRGINVQFELQDDNKHYHAYDPVSGRKSKYASNVRSDWT
jgi:hypothetical protein